MKNLKSTLIIILIASSMMVASCKKTSTSTNSTTSMGGNVTATIGGLTFQSTSANIIKSTTGFPNITIQGAQADGSNVNIQVTGLGAQYTPIVGTYSLYQGGVNSTNFVSTATYAPPVSGTTQKNYSSQGCDASLPTAGFVPNGTVTFTEISTTKIAGTFQFNAAYISNCSDVKLITAGTFSKTF